MKPKTLRALRASFCLTLPLAAADKPPPDSFPADAPAQSFLMIGNGHIDPVWLWPWQEGVNLVHSTFRSALDRLNENPDFTFTASSAQFYEWVAQNDPAMLAEIKQRVAEGRWGLVGGWWIEPDLNIPSGEALVRQGLYGQRSFQKLLGRKAVTGFNPDGFGHPGSLPQILRGQGLENYVFMRPNPKENAAIPASTFRWRSPDGSDVLAYRIPVRYGDDGSANIRKDLLRILKEFPVEKEPFPVRMAFYGVGDHGGGATKATLAAIRSLQTDPAAPKLSFSTPDAFFAQIRNRTAADNSAIRTNSFNSTFSDELQHHAVGCYSAHAEIKKNNRAAETALVTAEKLTAIGALAWGAACPRDALTTAWEAVLFQQFHDILAGTSLPGHYAAARDAHGHALHTANQASWLALQKLAWQIPTTDPESEYVLVFNPHPWPATLPVEIEVTTAQKPSKAYRLFPEVIENAAGEPVPFQTAPASTVTSSGRRTFVFNAKLPPFGWEQFRLRPLDGKKRDTLDTALIPQTDTTLENAFLAVTFDPDGRMTLRDKTTGATLVRDASAIVMEDRTDTWGHRTGPYDRETYDKQIGEFTGAELRVLEHGPVRKTIRVTTRYNNSTLSTDWTLNAGEPALEAAVTLDWHEHFKLLKYNFPTALSGSVNHTVETAYGHITRPADGHEQPGHRWIILHPAETGSGNAGTPPASKTPAPSPQNGADNLPKSKSANTLSAHSASPTPALLLLNDAKYAYSTPGADLRLTITRSPPHALHRRPKPGETFDHMMDQGRQTFRFKLIPQNTPDTAAATRSAEEFCAPKFALLQGIHPGKLPPKGSLLSLDAPNLVIGALKQSEDAPGRLVIRLHETAGQPADATLTILGNPHRIRLRPHELKTLLHDPAANTLRETNLLEE